MNKDDSGEEPSGQRRNGRAVQADAMASYLMLSVMMVVWALLYVWDSLWSEHGCVVPVTVMSGIAAMNFYQFYQFRC
ncbi:MAG: hypothetical protein ACLSVD_10055 [Eggerthellaceae bacterium]